MNSSAGEGSPTSELALHLECYRRYPEVKGVVHCHPAYASMFAVARRPIPPAIEEVVIYLGGDVPRVRIPPDRERRPRWRRWLTSSPIAAPRSWPTTDWYVWARAPPTHCTAPRSPSEPPTSSSVRPLWVNSVRSPAKVVADFQGVYQFMRSETW